VEIEDQQGQGTNEMLKNVVHSAMALVLCLATYKTSLFLQFSEEKYKHKKKLSIRGPEKQTSQLPNASQTSE
jgi:hypothetical protein